MVKMKLSNLDDEDDCNRDIGVEVVGIPRRKKQHSHSETADKTPKPSYLEMPHTETMDGVVEISLQGVPEAPSPAPRPPKIRHPAGSVLKPPGPKTQFLRPALRRRESDLSIPVTHVDGDPFPPCFRVVGVSPTPCSEPQALGPDSHSQKGTDELHVQRVPIPTLNNSTSSMLTDEQIECEDTHFSRTRDEYLQLDLAAKHIISNDAEQQLCCEPQEAFHDEEADSVVVNKSVDTSESHQSKTTTRNYLILTRQLLQQKIQRDKREQLCSPQSMPSDVNDAPSRQICGSFGYACIICTAFVLVGVGVLIVTLSVGRKDTQSTAALQSNNADNTVFIPAATTLPRPIPEDAGTTSPPLSSPAPNESTPQVVTSTHPEGTINTPLLPKDFPESTELILNSHDLDAPQVKAYQWLLQDPNLGEYPRWRQFQRMALATLYFSANGPQWHHGSHWLSYDGTECEWYPQACDSMGHIRRILLSSSNLEGTLPIELFWLTSLQQLQLANNRLWGPIPSQLGSLTALAVLWIQQNNFHAGISPALPTEIGRLRDSLLYLDVSGNPLGRQSHINNEDEYEFSRRDSDGNMRRRIGDIPTQVGLLTRLKELVLAHAGLSGTFPTEIGNLRELELLQLEGNELFGNLPSLGSLAQLRHFSAQENHFSGSLPNDWGSWTKLTLLDISINHLELSLPTTFASMESLRELWAYDNLLSGVLPSEFGLLSGSLTSLDLSMNTLEGSLPDQLGELNLLEGLWLFQNRLGGKLPTVLGNLHESLLQLSLFGNELIGSIPEEFNRLTSLRGLWLDKNFLSGTIPSALLTSTKLMSLHLFRNRLQGSLPEIPRSPYYAFQEVRLENNKLIGTIPSSLQQLHSNLAVLQLHQNEFTGTVPEQLGSLTNLIELTLHRNNQLSGSMPSVVCSLFDQHQLQYVSADCGSGSIQCTCCNACF